MAKSTSKSAHANVRLAQIVSGGQTGVDQAALDAAMTAGVSIGGWCPRGRRSESGQIPAIYPLKETTARSYAVRTEWNVRDSDGTLILVLDEVSKGTQLTLRMTRQLSKPCQVVHLRPSHAPSLFSDENSLNEQIDSVVDWLRTNRICVLNVAGPRGSSNPNVYPEALQFMELLLKQSDVQPNASD